MMRELGGYIELDTFRNPMLHEDGIKLNCGRNALAYLIKARGIKKIYLPYFLCSSVFNVCTRHGVDVVYYHIDSDFLPVNIKLDHESWIYIVNYYGQLGEDILFSLVNEYKQVIIDNAQAYFQQPLPEVDTLYTCRKFFGVSDGAILYTNHCLADDLVEDFSFERIHYVLGRFEKNASCFYLESRQNNDIFDSEPIKKMSKLTDNILHGVDYDYIRKRRTANFLFLHNRLKFINTLKVHPVDGAFMYPLMINDAASIKIELLKNNIYIPTLWPNVVANLPNHWWEWKLANNVLPLPCDQRYSEKDLEYMVELLSDRKEIRAKTND